LQNTMDHGHIDVVKWFINNNFKVPFRYRMMVYYNTIKTHCNNVIKLL
jgi:hypothetical protein